MHCAAAGRSERAPAASEQRRGRHDRETRAIVTNRCSRRRQARLAPSCLPLSLLSPLSTLSTLPPPLRATRSFLIVPTPLETARGPAVMNATVTAVTVLQIANCRCSDRIIGAGPLVGSRARSEDEQAASRSKRWTRTIPVPVSSPPWPLPTCTQLSLTHNSSPSVSLSLTTFRRKPSPHAWLPAALCAVDASELEYAPSATRRSLLLVYMTSTVAEPDDFTGSLASIWSALLLLLTSVRLSLAKSPPSVALSPVGLSVPIELHLRPGQEQRRRREQDK